MNADIDYLLIGPVVADIVPNGRIAGGTVSYAAPIARAFGHKVGVVTSNAPGEPLLAEVHRYADIMVRIADETTTFENVYHPEGRTQYIHHVAGQVGREHIPVGWLSAPIVHLAPLADRVDPQIAFDFPDATVLLTPQGWMRKWGADKKVHFKKWFDAEVLRAADIVVFSAEDIDQAPELEQEFAQAVKHLIVTRGKAGGTYYRDGVAIPYAAHQVEETDPTGAGDVFATCMLASLPLLDNDMQAAIRAAARLASNSVTRLGLAGAPTKEEIDIVLHEARQKT